MLQNQVIKLHIKRALVVLCVLLIFGLSFYRMNQHFNRLSRYPYDDQEARALIDKYMNDEEIEYIIEYSIEPAYFLDYIRAQDFNIYHVEYYRRLENVKWYNNNHLAAVADAERLYRNVEDMDEAIERMRTRTVTEVIESFEKEK